MRPVRLTLLATVGTAAVTCVVALGGCSPLGNSGSDDVGAAAGVAMRMWDLAARGKGERACELWDPVSLTAMADLDPGGCARRLKFTASESDLDTLELAAEPVTGGDATVRVRLRAGKDLLLTELLYMDDTGWLVTDYESRRLGSS